MKKLAIALGVALLVAGGLYYYLLAQSQQERRRTGELESRLAALQSPQPDQSFPGSATRSSAAGADGAEPVPGAAADVAPSAGNDANPLAAASEQMMNSPEGREFMRSMTRMNLEQRYPDIAKELGLSAEEVDKLFDLLAQRTTEFGMAMVAGRGESDRAAREEAGRRMAELEQAHESELAALLGERYPKWKEYERTASMRQVEEYRRQERTQLRVAISTRGDELSDAQFQSLLAALEAEQRRMTQESGGQSPQQELQRLPDTHRRLIEVASGHLNAQQLEGYRRYLQQQADTARAMSSFVGAAGTDF